MAKLYPPYIAGTLPPIINAGSNGPELINVNLSIPFTMNKTVSLQSVSGISIRIKHPYTDSVLAEIIAKGHDINWNTYEINTFAPDLPIEIGQFYKIQLAYIGADAKTIGYYSTVGVAKCTNQPKVTIANLFTHGIQDQHAEYIGLYDNTDTSEKVYKDRFVFGARDKLTPGSEPKVVLYEYPWELHNSLTDLSESYSYRCLTKLDPIQTDMGIITIRYEVITVNGLHCYSDWYQMYTESASDDVPTNIVSINVENRLDYGDIKVTIRPHSQTDTIIYNANYCLCRASDKDNFFQWTELARFTLACNDYSSYEYHDYCIGHGEKYQYAVRQYWQDDGPQIYDYLPNFSYYYGYTVEQLKQIFSDLNIDLDAMITLSKPVYSSQITADFEDLFIYDGERQLKVKYNPKVNSFKAVLGDNKKITLGSQYPFILRSGDMNYHEFPIGGLISYWMDNEELFLNHKDDLHMADDWENTTNMTADNTSYELKFKLAVMNWLSDGRPKLVKSATEGNYIVRLTDVSLTPVEQVARMLHTFSCNATEIAEYTLQNLIDYGFMPLVQNKQEIVIMSKVSLQSIWNKLASETYANGGDKLLDRVSYLTEINILPKNSILTKVVFSDIKVPIAVVTNPSDPDVITEPADEHFYYNFKIGSDQYTVNGGLEMSFAQSDGINTLTFTTGNSSALIRYLLQQGTEAKIPGYIYYQCVIPAELQTQSRGKGRYFREYKIPCHQVIGDGNTNILENLIDGTKMAMSKVYRFRAKRITPYEQKFAPQSSKNVSVPNDFISVDGVQYQIDDNELVLDNMNLLPWSIIPGNNIKVTLTFSIDTLVYDFERKQPFPYKKWNKMMQDYLSCAEITDKNDDPEESEAIRTEKNTSYLAERAAYLTWVKEQLKEVQDE